MLPGVSVGDHVVHPLVFTMGGRSWQRRYDVLAVQPGTRFGRPDLLVNVRISCVDTDTGDARVTDADRPMWLSQIAQGL